MNIVCVLLVLMQPLLSQRVVKTWDFRPECFPYDFQLILDIQGDHFFHDLDKDGSNEWLVLDPDRVNSTPPSIKRLELFQNMVWQYNFHNTNIEIKPGLQFLNVNDDPADEIVITYTIKDSIFIDIINLDGERQAHFFHSAHPRRIVDGDSIQWMPSLNYINLVDINHDNQKECVTVFRGGHNQMPRGLFVHSFPDGALIDTCLIGPEPRDVFLQDFDQDGKFEMIMHTNSPANGARGQGLTDRVPYVLHFKFQPQAVLVDSIPMGDCTFTRSNMFYADFVGNSDKEFVAIRRSDDTGQPTRIVVIDPATFNILRDETFEVYSRAVCLIRDNDQLRPDLLFSNMENQLIRMDNTLTVLDTIEMPMMISSLRTGPDLDADGIPEIVAHGYLRSVVLDHTLKIKAIWPDRNIYQQTMTYPNEANPVILTRSTNNSKLYRVVRNGKFIFARHWEPLLSMLGASLAVLVLLFAFKEHTQHKIIDRFIEHIVESDSRAIAIVDKRLRTINFNQHLLDWFGLQRPPKRKSPALNEWLHNYPKIASTLVEWREAYSHIRRDKVLNVDTQQGTRSVKLIFEPIPHTFLARRVFLVSFNDLTIQDELEKIQHWREMAQRVAHDLKSPLGTIHLILQKLRGLVTKQHKGAAEVLLPYFHKIQDRVESLRAHIRDFLIFVDLEEPQLNTVNINAFLNDLLDDVEKEMPPDIELRRHIPEEITAVDIDDGQMASALRNLLTNSKESMPDGGSITVSSKLAHRLQFPNSDDRPRDYALIEIQDTGTGMPPDVLDRIFEPNFSYFKESSGLGLTIVKKIIDDHHAHIEVESEVDIGTLFTIYIPVKSSL